MKVKREPTLNQKLRRFHQQNEWGWTKPINHLRNQLPIIKKLYANNGLRLELTCEACPEQYEVFDGEKQVAYLRLRHGYYSVTVPDVMGEDILNGEPVGEGMFEPEERFNYMAKTLRLIQKTLKPNTHEPNRTREIV